MNVLKIVIKGVFFDSIAARTKVIEYREDKPFWRTRLYDEKGKKRVYDKIEFINGYNKDARRMITKFEGFSLKAELFHIKIGKIIRKPH